MFRQKRLPKVGKSRAMMVVMIVECLSFRQKRFVKVGKSRAMMVLIVECLPAKEMM